jgi:Na+/H+ antiporter NhaD/arsenite permease-like protein
MQLQVQCNPLKGFWLVSAAAFLVAPFLTNDGVCLLFVELILDAFDATKSISNNSHLYTTLSSPEQRAKIVLLQEMPLETGDAIYFLLTLACSANIGSALTYTGLFYHYLLLQYQYFLSISFFFHMPLTN